MLAQTSTDDPCSLGWSTRATAARSALVWIVLDHQQPATPLRERATAITSSSSLSSAACSDPFVPRFSRRSCGPAGADDSLGLEPSSL